MGCCGQHRSSAHVNGAERPSTERVLFEYQGPGRLTLYGHVTGIRYQFPGPGARLPVDPRDARAVALVEHVVRIP